MPQDGKSVARGKCKEGQSLDSEAELTVGGWDVEVDAAITECEFR